MYNVMKQPASVVYNRLYTYTTIHLMYAGTIAAAATITLLAAWLGRLATLCPIDHDSYGTINLSIH